MSFVLQWRHNGCDCVSNHQPHDCLLNRLFRRRSKKISKLRVTGLYVGNSPVTGEFPAQTASYAENAFIWWRHHGNSFHMAHRAESMSRFENTACEPTTLSCWSSNSTTSRSLPSRTNNDVRLLWYPWIHCCQIYRCVNIWGGEKIRLFISGPCW